MLAQFLLLSWFWAMFLHGYLPKQQLEIKWQKPMSNVMSNV